MPKGTEMALQPSAHIHLFHMEIAKRPFGTNMERIIFRYEQTFNGNALLERWLEQKPAFVFGGVCFQLRCQYFCLVWMKTYLMAQTKFWIFTAISLYFCNCVLGDTRSVCPWVCACAAFVPHNTARAVKCDFMSHQNSALRTAHVPPQPLTKGINVICFIAQKLQIGSSRMCAERSESSAIISPAGNQLWYYCGYAFLYKSAILSLLFLGA